MTRGCLLLAISFSCSWQKRISWCRLIRSSCARKARRCFFVSSGTLIRANILADGVCAASHLGDVAPGPFLVEELLAEKEPVHQEMKTLIEPVQGIDLLGVMPIILHKLPDDRVVSLFHMGIVIFVVGMGPSKGDSTDMTEEDEMPPLPLSEWRHMTFPGCLCRHNSGAATT
jgi:hypothetical protein